MKETFDMRHVFHPGFAAAALFLTVAAMPGPVSANEYAAQIQRFVDARIRPWLQDPEVVAALHEQNAEHAGLDQAGIDRLDDTWRGEAELGGGPMISQVLSRPLSQLLTRQKNSNGTVVTEMFLMDNRGLNAGQSDVTSDYWQGDEAKWQKTFLVGPDAVFIDEIEFDESTEMFQTQVSVSIADPATGDAIGAVTIGLNVEELQ
ncbi:MAG: hypothetical protein KDH19_16775 [Geminicoccaceae bacterium]|nr:hypothetical protein [Geminicoccaceae bacterium]MCB2011483.1 hypothetical protein [Geminicoccaceae bacterium]